MYSVSNDYLTAIHGAVQSGHISGMIGAVAFTASDVLLGSASISNQCADSTDVKLGAVFVGTLKITFCNRNLVPRGSWEGKTITVYWNQLVDDQSEPKVYETIPCGKFVVSEANHAAEGVVVTAYDNMCRFDKELQFTTTAGSPYNLAKSICETCNVGLGMTKAEIEALPNGLETLSLYPDNDCKTYRDVISWLAMTLGSFATINRNGDLVFKTFDNTPLITFSASERIAGGNFSDFESYFTQITVQDLANDTAYTEKMPSNTGLSMDLGANPFMQYGLTETKHDVRLAVLGSLTGLKYTPFTTSLLGNPAFDLGDCIEFTGGNAGTSVKCCVMAFTYTFNRVFNVSGFGKNPATMGAESKTDKAVNQNAKNSSSNEIQYLKYQSSEDIEIEYGFDTDVRNGDPVRQGAKVLLTTISIDVIKETDVEIDSRILANIYTMPTIVNISGSAFLAASFGGFVYELDGEEFAQSVDIKGTASNAVGTTYWGGTFGDETFSFPLFPIGSMQPQAKFSDHQTIMRIPANTHKTLRVYGLFFARMGAATTYNLAYNTPDSKVSKLGKVGIASGGIEIIVKGQGLAKEEKWNGLIILSDELGLQIIAGYGIEDLADNVSAKLLDNLVNQYADSINQEDYSTIVFDNLAESLSVYLTAITFNLVTEDEEYNIVTEDETYNLVTET